MKTTHWESKKLIKIFIGITVFAVGVFAGSFLVLRSETGEALFASSAFGVEDISSDHDVRQLLLDLERLHERGELTTPEIGENLSRLFLEKTDQAVQDGLGDTPVTDAPSIDPEQFANEINLEGVFASFIAEHVPAIQKKLFPNTATIQVDASAQEVTKKYLEKADDYFTILALAWHEVLSFNPGDIQDENTLRNMRDLIEMLERVDREFEAVPVHPSYVEVHTNLLILSNAIQTTILDGIVRNRHDPIRAVITLQLLDEVEEFGTQTLEDLFEMYDTHK